MKYAIVLTDMYNISDNPVKEGSILNVVNDISDKNKQDYWITTTEILERYMEINSLDFQIFTDEKPDMIYQLKYGQEKWETVSQNKYQSLVDNVCYQSRILYEVNQ